jgi:hypothetical protein
MRVNTRPRKRNAPRPAEKSAPAFLQWLRGRECFVGIPSSKVICEGKIEAAHVDHAGGKGVATKVADRHAIPLCSRHHRLQHEIGWREFEERYMFGAVNIAASYWRAWPGRIAWERKMEGRNG